MRRLIIITFALICVFSTIVCDSAYATEKEISWQKAASEVDSFPFTIEYVDSLRKTLRCFSPTLPLKVEDDYTVFYPETLVYKISWGPFNAGYVVLTTLYDSVTNTIKVGGKALSNNFVSAFYRMRDYVMSTIHIDGLYPVFFEQHLREGKRYRSEEYLLFDHAKRRVHVKTRKNFKTVETKVPFVHDYLSVLHHIRATRALAPGDTFSEVLFVHKKVHSIFFSVSASEEKIVPVGTFPCVVLKPRLVGNGRAFTKKDKLEIWMSKDKKQIPVAIRSKIKFGSIDARLIWYNRATAPTEKAE